MSSSRNRQAAKAVALAENIPTAGRRELLDMLGLLDDTRRGIAPDPPEHAPEANLFHLNGAKGDMSSRDRLTTMYEPPRDHYTHLLPPGLRVMPSPEQARTQARVEAQARTQARAEAKAAPRPPRTIAPRPKRRNGELGPPTPGPRCGQSLGGRSWHVRRGETLCDPCRDYFNAYQRARKAQRRTEQGELPGRRPRPPCGSPTGAKAHRIRGEQICEPCLQARRVDNRERWHRLKDRNRDRDNARRQARKAARRAAEQEPPEAQAS